MEKRKVLFGIFSASLLAASVGAVALGNGLSINASAETHTDKCNIHHYAAVDPTLDTNGVKEYWICCDHSSQGPEFAKPAVGVVTDATHPSGFAATISATDARYVAPYSKLVSFEDGTIPSFLSVASGTASVTDSQASEGTKSLKFEGAFKLKFDTKYLEAALADEDAILFDIKGDAYAANLYYSSQTEQWGVHRYDQVYNIGNDAVQTHWKTFAFNKSALSDLNNGELIRVDGAKSPIYVDNIRIGKAETNDRLISFEDYGVHIDTTNKIAKAIPLYKAYSAAVTVFDESKKVDLDVSISQDYASEGNSSLHIVSETTIKTYIQINKAMYDATSVGFLFDIFTPDDAAITNIKNRYKAEGGNVYYTPQNYTAKGKWVTFFAPKSALYDGDYLLLRFDNAIVNNVYIDNIRVADVNFDFENGEIITQGSRVGYGAKYDGKYVKANEALFANNGSDIWYNGTFDVSKSSEKSTTGTYSLKAVCGAKNGGIYISPRVYDLLPAAGLTMDIWVNKAVNFFSVVSGQSGVHDWDAGKWITITVPKSYIGQNGSGEYVLFTYGDTITSYIDNVRVAS